MSTILIPENQEIYPNPNTHINFEFDNSIEEYRTSRYLNQILKMFGPDVILWGLTLEDYTYNDNLLTLNFTNGSLIQDSTLIRVLYPFSLSINISSDYYSNKDIEPDYYVNPVYMNDRYIDTASSPISGGTILNSNYSIVLITEFKFQVVTEIPTSPPNIFNIKLGLLKHSPNTFYNIKSNIFDFDITKNRIVLYAASIDNLYVYYDEVNINGYIYHVPGTIKPPIGDFAYHYFTYDGGLIDIC